MSMVSMHEKKEFFKSDVLRFESPRAHKKTGNIQSSGLLKNYPRLGMNRTERQTERKEKEKEKICVAYKHAYIHTYINKYIHS